MMRSTLSYSQTPVNRRSGSKTTEAGGLEIKVARIFNTYGPRMHRADGRVVSNFIIQALAGEPITLYGDGNQTRSFVSSAISSTASCA